MQRPKASNQPPFRATSVSGEPTRPANRPLDRHTRAYSVPAPYWATCALQRPSPLLGIHALCSVQAPYWAYMRLAASKPHTGHTCALQRPSPILGIHALCSVQASY
jgi:hypothetical protein